MAPGMLSTTLFLLLGILLTLPLYVQNEHYSIVLSQDQCESLKGLCMTLSSFATNNTNYLQSSRVTELVLLPGNHSLSSKLTITHIDQLWVLSNSSQALGTNTVCINHTARFEFTNIAHILISDVKFLGCGGISAESVMNFSLINITFDGQRKKRTGTALELVNICGAVVVKQCNAIFLNCNFNRNHAKYGGAIYGDLTSNISIVNSTFYNNTAEESGGAIFAGSFTVQDNVTESGMLSIIASNFFFNEVYEELGGGVAVFHINVSIRESKFLHNAAQRANGGALLLDTSSMAIISRTDFSGNNATHDCGGAVHMLKSTLMISNSTFSRNSIVKGHGGALCLQDGSNIISDCNFIFNEAATFGGAIYTRNSHHTYLERCFFDTNTVRSQAGGGRTMRIYRESNLKITNSSFINRESLMYSDGNKVFHNHTPICQESNAGYRISGVGLIIASSTVVFNSTKFIGSCGSIYAYKCNINFTRNNIFMEINNEISKAPSALYIIQSTVSIDENCTFMCNVAVSGGAIHAVESRIDVNGELVVINNTALDNGGGIYLYRSDFNCKIGSTVKIIGNNAEIKGGGLHAISSAIKVTYVRDSNRSSLFFTGNTATNGGGVYLEANAKLLVLKEGTTINSLTHESSIFFRKNKANESGGAVYVADETNAATCEGATSSHLNYSDATECFIQVLTLLLLDQVQNKDDLVSIEFENNSAQSGAMLFGGLLDRCTVNPIAEIHKVNNNIIWEGFEKLGPGITYFVSITNIINFEGLKSHDIRSEPVQICFCDGNTSNCSYQQPPLKVTHGKEFKIPLVAVDQANYIVENVIIFSSMESSLNWLSKGQIVQNTSENCTDLTFSILSSGNLSVPHNDTLHLYPDGPCKSVNRSKRTIQIHLQPCNCPIGFEISSERDKCDCMCDSKLKDYTTNCSATKGVLMRENNFWISAMTKSTLKFCDSSKYIGHLKCPFDYCISGNSRVEVNLSATNGTDVQCANNRIGILCSQCKRGYSLSIGSSNCVHCPRFWIAQMTGIILALLIAGIILVTLLPVLNLTVTVGTINGLIFYANIVGSTSKPLTFVLPQFIVAWLNLESGFDGCFINGLDAYWNTWLKFAFPMYVFFLVASIIVLSRFFPKFSRLIGKRNPVATLNTLILLSYSKLLHVVISIFLFTTLDCPGGSSKSIKVWVVDATIEYLSPKHLILFIVAILVLLTGTIYTLLLFSWQWLLLYQDKWLFRWVRNQKLCQFLEPYHAPYTFKHRYWTGLMLLVRVILFALLATNTSQDPYASLVAISIAVSSLILIKGVFTRVYKNHLPNILEVVCLMNILFLCIANFYTISNGNTKMQKNLAYISGSITTILSLFVIAYHMHTEIVIKHKLWIYLKCFTMKNAVMIRDLDAAVMHQPVISVVPSSYTTSVVEAPTQQEPLKSYRESNANEADLRKPLLKSLDGTTAL